MTPGRWRTAPQRDREARRRTWFFLTADYAFGYALERDTETSCVKSAASVGQGTPPISRPDVVVPFTAAGEGLEAIIGLPIRRRHINSIKQHRIASSRRSEACRPADLRQRHPCTRAQDAQGLIFTDPWYWTRTTQNRHSRREYFTRSDRIRLYRSRVYSAVIHYLRASAALAVMPTARPVIADRTPTRQAS